MSRTYAAFRGYPVPDEGEMQAVADHLGVLKELEDMPAPDEGEIRDAAHLVRPASRWAAFSVGNRCWDFTLCSPVRRQIFCYIKAGRIAGRSSTRIVERMRS
jgi:hypothetical protein